MSPALWQHERIDRPMYGRGPLGTSWRKGRYNSTSGAINWRYCWVDNTTDDRRWR